MLINQNKIKFDSKFFNNNLKTKNFGRNFLYFESISSTMEVALQEAANKAPSGTLILAEEQTKGQGREKRNWVSGPFGNLYFSIFTSMGIFEDALKLNFACPVAVTKGLRKLGLTTTGIKWPNDVWIGGKKICGLLVNTDNSMIHAGIGINVFQDMSKNSELKDIATSVKQELHIESERIEKDYSHLRETVLCDILLELENLVEKSLDDLLKIYKEYDILIGKRIIVMPKKREDPSSYYEATAVDINRTTGQLMIKKEGSDEAVPLVAEEVSIRPE